jgi:ABC-2 type transport system permease protein
MKGLVIKDIYTLTRQMKIYLFMIVILALMPGYSTTSFAIVYSAMLPITALAYDERSKWDHLAVMMPYSVKSIVLSKYTLGYIAIITASLMSIIAQSIISLVTPIAADAEGVVSIIFISFVAMLMLALNLPLMFKVGVEKGRFTFFIVVAVIVFGGTAFGDMIKVSLSAVDLSLSIVLLVSLAAVFVINLISIGMSIRFYKKREF